MLANVLNYCHDATNANSTPMVKIYSFLNSGPISEPNPKTNAKN